MATYAPRRPLAPRARALTGARAGVVTAVAGVLGLMAVSVLIRTQHLDVGYWIDEGLSVGIADRPLGDIPGILRLDGSPPLYYMLLHAWMRVTGSATETATHALSLCLAIACVPIAFAGARALFGARAGWIMGGLTALNPFLTQYAQETRMYALVIFFGTIATLAFVGAIAQRRRAALPVFVLALAGMLYTHNWSLFFGAATGVTWLALVALSAPEERRALVRDGLLAYGAVALIYAPWLPTLLFQAAHTGAPWSEVPDLGDLVSAPARLLGAVAQVALLLAGGAGLAAVLGRRPFDRGDREARSAIALIALSVLTISFAWAASQVSPAWALRYLSVALAPLLLLSALGLARAGRMGLVGLALVAVMWAPSTGRAEKSNVRSVAESLAPSLRSGDLVVSTWPEQIPVLAHYLPPGLKYATLWGSVNDLGVTDWRDGVARLRATSVPVNLRPLLDEMPEGGRLVLVQPAIYSLGRWQAPWTGLIRVRSEEWGRAITADPRFRVSAVYPPSPFPERPIPVRATVFLKQATR